MWVLWVLRVLRVLWVLWVLKVLGLPCALSAVHGQALLVKPMLARGMGTQHLTHSDMADGEKQARLTPAPVCAGTGLNPAHICAGTGLDPAPIRHWSPLVHIRSGASGCAAFGGRGTECGAVQAGGAAAGREAEEEDEEEKDGGFRF